jgi:hypothetical protein
MATPPSSLAEEKEAKASPLNRPRLEETLTQQDFQWMELLALLLHYFVIKSLKNELVLAVLQERQCF